MNKTFKQIENNPLKEYEARQAEIKKLLKQIEAGLEKHDRNGSGTPGERKMMKNLQSQWDTVSKA